ncbi:MAG: protein kinase [Polyangiaceae bacterium]|nr:protein kinase [Polyangiaceae bacterium]
MTSENGFPSGTILAGRYQVRRELGHGGMGVVYLCRDLVLDERVAVKLLSRPDAKIRPEDAWGFQEEARALARLAHPAIVQARDFGALPDGTPYLVMNAVPGRSLHEWLYLALTEGTIPWPVTWSVVDQVLGALAHAHARGVIHGDLKPSNVMVELTDGEEPHVHVLDLGLAWLMQDIVDHRLDGSRAAEPTVRWGAGTPGWMAPEQIRFAAPHVGPPTDLYALGCILFGMLSNREPYESANNEELCEMHKKAPIPDPVLEPGVPTEVGGFVKRLMAKRPWHRYEFATDARRAWKRFKPTEEKVSATETPIMGIPAARISLRPSEARINDTDTLDFAREVEQMTTIGLLGMRPSPFVARSAERAQLMNLVSDVIDSTVPVHRFLVLAGEAGVGKSRLAEWLCEEVHERGLMIPLRARYRTIPEPLDGVVGAVNAHYRLERADRDVVERVLMNVWEVEPNDEDGKTWVAATAEWLRPLPPGSDHVGPTGKRFALDRPELRWLVIRRTLERIGRTRPILLWLDDLHNASQTTFEGLGRIHKDATRLGLMIVATVRAEALEADADAKARIERLVPDFGAERLDIAPLNPAQTYALLKETLPLDEAAIQEAAARSKGNPLFALQLVHAWAGGGHFTLKDGRYVVPKSSLIVRAGTTTELWEERLRVLPDDLRPAAFAAAALGGDVRTDVLTHSLAALNLDPERAIEAMRRAQIVLASGGERMRWPHALLQEHLLTQLAQQKNANRVFRAAADALALHPNANLRRILRQRVVNLTRAGDVEAAAKLLHEHIALIWGRTREVAATLRDLALLDGRLSGTAAAMQKRWRAEALRYAGKLEDARREAEDARRIFQSADDIENAAHCLRLLGHIASDLAAPAHGRRLVARALGMFTELGHEHGRALCEVLLGEIDYLLGDHASARAELGNGAQRFATVGDRLGRAQCLLLQSWVEQAGGATALSIELARTARGEFDAIGYRLGLAQADVTLAHAEHRAGRLASARTIALSALSAFRDVGNPRGEAACERLLAMTALDAGDPALAEAHAHAARLAFDKLADPWGQVETKLIVAQIALDRGDAEGARAELIACEAVALVEAEPKQHRHLTMAWLAYHEGRFHDAARELDAARAAFKEAGRTGDHTPQLLERFARMGWPKPASQRIATWRKAITAAGG